SVTDIIATVTAEEGELVTYLLRKPDENENHVVAQSSTDGGRTYITVAKSAVVDGVFRFIAPVRATYRITVVDGINFDDVPETHWAYDYVDFASAREVVLGVGGNLFVPEGDLTRSMFVTMLGRMHGNLGT